MVVSLSLLVLSSGPFAPAPVCPLTDSDRSALAAKLGPTRAFVFCLPNDQVIRRTEPFQAAWLSQADRPTLHASARPGQFLTFQIGVLGRSLTKINSLEFSALQGKPGSISGKAARCISLGGIDMHGQTFHKTLAVGTGRLQPLWCGWDIPVRAKGTYTGSVTLRLQGQTERIPIQITVAGDPVVDGGVDDPRGLTRLRWLDSTAGQGSEITKPFVPVRVSGREIHVLGRDLRLAETGLPAAIVSHFSSANTVITKSAKPVLDAPMNFVVQEGTHSTALRARMGAVVSTPTTATWNASGSLGKFAAEIRGHLDFTGSGQIKVHLKADQDMDLKDMRLNIPFTTEASKYLMGLNRPGGKRPESLSWKWDVKRHQDCFWLGDVNGGLMVRLKDANFHRPLLNIYYSFLPLALPDSWGNGGQGGVQIAEENGHVVARAYSGPRHIRKGQTLDFIADFYLTPFRTIDTEKQWSTRFIHPHSDRNPKPLDDALASADPKRGPNVINVHQATYYNPYINYPYSPDSYGDFAKFVKRAHDKGVRARVYYTTREITQNMPELYALHALNGEVVFPGPGKDAKTLINPNGPNPWLIKNLGSDFVPAWVDHVGGKYAQDDISVITTPDSRWNNFYLEGLKWMVDRAKIDGVYIDDTALDASSLRRARRILSVRPDPLIDLHTWNHFNDYAGYANNLNMYMEVLPYLDRLWLGEGFSANAAAPDYWLVEMSGLPFGLMSEMLDSPNTARGLVFGETGRLGWSGDPRPVWQLFDQFGMAGTTMHPYFAPDCPVRTGDPQVLATVYQGKHRAMIALGSWATQPVDLKLQVDWHALGIDPATATLEVPEVSTLQYPKSLKVGDPITVPPAGLVLIIRG